MFKSNADRLIHDTSFPPYINMMQFESINQAQEYAKKHVTQKYRIIKANTKKIRNPYFNSSFDDAHIPMSIIGDAIIQPLKKHFDEPSKYIRLYSQQGDQYIKDLLFKQPWNEYIIVRAGYVMIETMTVADETLAFFGYKMVPRHNGYSLKKLRHIAR